MRILLIIVIALLLTSCSEESNIANEKNKQIDNNNVKLDQNSFATISAKDQEEESKDRLDNNKWDTIVNPQDANTNTTTAVKKEDSLDEINDDPKTRSSDIESKFIHIPYKPNFNVCEHDMVLGDSKSCVVVVEYFSPTCPHCAYYHEKILPELKKKYIDTNKIAYIIREFISNKQDLDAAVLGRCKNNLDSFLKFQNVILAEQDKWGASYRYRELLTNIAQIGGISEETYTKCLNDDKITEILLANTQLAANARGFIGTPSFFVNGALTNGYCLDVICKAIDQALKSKSIQ